MDQATALAGQHSFLTRVYGRFVQFTKLKPEQLFALGQFRRHLRELFQLPPTLPPPFKVPRIFCS